ncbi:riboflavin synthase [Cellulomonas aerilata]|uniref:Riboflavin synthase n=1 Tax=Cellulomonas aerilata TaxID=515326 RepID=A0A512DAD0_9CELL|nr:riboflavin synthase [Cellulomonas aerilata]GEO33436.1 riboflavin synthase subunit alpha [Cellulomonas aerilata]
MFTGIVEEVGTVVSVAPGSTEGTATEADVRLTVRGPLVTSDAALGDSISVSGVCLTVADLPGNGTFTADVMPESLRRTALGSLVPGAPVNLERAVRADARLGGHVVQGHVDGVGTIVSRTPGPRWDDVVVRLPVDLAGYVAEKGSIAVSGVSLTVTHVGPDTFGVSLIPTTLAATTLGDLAPGSAVNLEVDVIAKYVERLLATGHGAAGTSGTSGATGTTEALR